MPKGTEVEPRKLAPTRWEIIRAHLDHECEASPAELHAKIKLVYISDTMDMTRKLIGILKQNGKIASPKWGVYSLVYMAPQVPVNQAATTIAPPTPVKAPEPQAQAPQQAVQRQTESTTKQPKGETPNEKFFIIAEAAGGPIKITYTGSIRVEFMP